jgi:hypothetical protein
MKFHLAIFSALSIGLYLVWLGYNYAKALGSAFGNLDPALGPDHVGFVLVLVGVLSAACIIAAIFTPYDVGRILALLPIALVVVGEGYFVHTERGRLTEHARIQDARQSIREDRIEQISKDYVLRQAEGEHFQSFKYSFLTHDRDSSALVRIDVGFRSEISAYCIGRIEGTYLAIIAEEDSFAREFYSRYLDEEGRSVFDDYRIRFDPNQDHRDCHFEKYEL